jgi:toxin-antitoxin system PIN domain toxin
MILVDVNILVYAHRKEAGQHDDYRDWLHTVVAGEQAYGMSDLVLSGFLRIVTNSKIFKRATPLRRAQTFVELLRDQPNCVRIEPGARHWDLFTKICRASSAKGNLVPDAYFAALAIESGSEWITADRDYARFPGLRWRHPLTGATR